MDSLSKVLILSFLKTTNMAFPIFSKSSRSLCAGAYRDHFCMHSAYAKDRNMQICSWKCSVRVWKTWSRSFFEVSIREHCIREAESWIDLWNKDAICKNISSTKPSLVKRRRFQMFKKAYHEKWPCITVDEKSYTCVNSEVCSTVVKWLDWLTLAWTLKFTVLLWNDWTGWQSSLICVQHSQLYRIGKRGSQCRLPCNCPENLVLDFFNKCRDTFADVFLKIMLCFGFCRILFLKAQFLVSHVCTSVQW